MSQDQTLVVVGPVAFIGFLATIPGLPENVAKLSGPDVEMAHNYVHGPYGAAAMLCGFLLSGFSGWKNAPVSRPWKPNCAAMAAVSKPPTKPSASPARPSTTNCKGMGCGARIFW